MDREPGRPWIEDKLAVDQPVKGAVDVAEDNHPAGWEIKKQAGEVPFHSKAMEVIIQAVLKVICQAAMPMGKGQADALDLHLGVLWQMAQHHPIPVAADCLHRCDFSQLIEDNLG